MSKQKNKGDLPFQSVEPKPKQSVKVEEQKLPFKTRVYESMDKDDRDLIEHVMAIFNKDNPKTSAQSNQENSGVVDLTPKLDSTYENDMVELLTNKKKKELFDTSPSGVKRLFSRVGFHLKAMGGAILTTVLSTFIPASIAFSSASVLLATYLGLLLLFPPSSNRFATIMGVVVGIITAVVAGAWPLSIAFAGLATAIIHIINRRRFVLSNFLTLPLLVLFLGLATSGGDSTFISMPTWFYALTAGAIAIGVLRPHKVEAWVNKMLLSSTEKKKLELALKEELAKNPSDASASSIDGSASPYGIHLERLRDLEKLVTKLPEDMGTAVNNIGHKAMGIIKCMEEDPRDVIPGNQFLNRYLPLIKKSLDRYLSLSSYDAYSEEFKEVKELTEQVLSSMSHAFIQMHKRLLDNDVDDLLVDLKVMDRLIKSQGFDTPKE